MALKHESLSPRGAVESPSTAPRVRSLAKLAKTKTGKTLTGLAVLGIFIALGRWAGQDDTPEATSDNPESPLQIENLKSFTVRQDGQRWWELAAAEVQLSPTGDMTTIKKVNKGIFYRDDQPFLTLRSPLVRLSNRTNNVMAMGGVQVNGANGFSLKTAQTLWINRTKTIECAKPVVATLRGMTFSAPQLFYNWKDGILSCPKPVEVQATGARLSARQFQANTNTRVLDLGGGAEFEFDPRTVKPEQLRGLVDLSGAAQPTLGPTPKPAPR